jgi:putative ABC transport system substrate-binding protein
VLDRRTAEGKLERLNDIVADLVRLKTDVIVAVGHPSIIPAVKAVTAPIVLVPSFFDPIEAGLVESFARPGRNVTGLSITPSAEIEGKRLALLKEALPRVQLVGLLGMAADWDDAFGQAIQRAARQLGIRVFHADHSHTDYSGAFASIVQQRPDALIVANTPVNFGNRKLIVEFTTTNRLPGMFSRGEYVEAGGLMSYGVDITDLFRRSAVFVQRILNGTSPAEMPVEQPTRFEFHLNLKTAAEFGISVPPRLLERADRVIE